MKINEIKLLAIELEEWAMKDGRKGGWKKIVPQITAHHYGDLLDSLADKNGSEQPTESHCANRKIAMAYKAEISQSHRFSVSGVFVRAGGSA